MIITNNKKLILVICFSLLCCILWAQSLSIKKVSLQPSDRTAVENVCYDNNGDTCALIKIKTNGIEGILFPNSNQYIKVHYTNGIYSVYVPAISRKIDFLHKDYMPIQLDMSDFGYRHLKKGMTYLVILDAPHINNLKSTIVIKVFPGNSTVVFDEKELGANPNGTFEIPVESGRHLYTVSADNYTPQNGMLTIDKSEAKTITVKLQPIMHEVQIDCNVRSAHVFVDNIDYGIVGKRLIPQGIHMIRVQADGYVDFEQEVNVSSTIGRLSCVLKENKQITHVHAIPVTIYSESSSIYKNNKKIKEWSSGATIMFMPGKYQLSDDKGNTYNLVVKKEPITVEL